MNERLYIIIFVLLIVLIIIFGLTIEKNSDDIKSIERKLDSVEKKIYKRLEEIEKNE